MPQNQEPEPLVPSQNIVLMPRGFDRFHCSHLERIVEQQLRTDAIVGHCTCKIGGPRMSELCPVHKPHPRTTHNFDPYLKPESATNKRAADERNWRYDKQMRVYRDEDGAPRADRFGQPL